MFWLISIFVMAIDQVTKYLAVNNLRSSVFTIIPGIFELTYVENRGAAFGIFQNQQIFITVTSGIVAFCILCYIIFARPKNKLLVLSISLIFGGALGNLIDRVIRSYVVDFFRFIPINFPVFNVADCCVCVGSIVLAYYILFLEGKKDKIIEA